MHVNLRAILETNLLECNFAYIAQQKGMFSFTGLTPEQVERLQSEFGVYIVSNSRMCMSGLNVNNIDYVADPMVAVLQD